MDQPTQTGAATEHAEAETRSGFEIGKERQRALIRLGSNGPFTVEMATPIYGDYEKTREGIRKAVRKGWLTEAGAVQMQELGGVKSKVYVAAMLKVKKDWLPHDTMLHRWKLLVPNAKVILGYDCDPEYLADGEAEFSNGIEGVIEMDMQTESLSEVLKRLEVHKGHAKNIFFITLSEPRIDKIRLRLHDDDLAGRIWFAVWYDLIRKPNLWQDVEGDEEEVYPLGG